MSPELGRPGPKREGEAAGLVVEMGPSVEHWGTATRGWREALLEDVASEVTVGYVGPMALEYVPDGVPFLRSQNVEPLRIDRTGTKFITPEFHQKLKKSALTPGDVVIVRTGKPGASAVVPESLPVSNCSDLVIVRCGPELDPAFLAYYVNAVAGHHVSAHLVGAVQQHFNVASARKIRMLLPPLAEQRAISHILGTLDDKIELNRRMNETLEAMARALFKSWFVDFDPVRAKAAGRDPLLPWRIAELFPSSLEETPLGEVPTAWTVETVGEHAVNSDSRRVPVSGAERARRQGPYPYHGAAGVLDHLDNYLFDGTYLLVGEDGSVIQDNGLAVTQYVWDKFWVSNHAHVLQGRGAVTTEQLYLYFQFEPVVPYVTGAVQAKLSQGRMNTMPFVFAGERVCRAFGEVVQPWFAKWRSNADANEVLATVRDALLPKLISGEARVQGAERFI